MKLQKSKVKMVTDEKVLPSLKNGTLCRIKLKEIVGKNPTRVGFTRAKPLYRDDFLNFLVKLSSVDLSV